jgi:hypothetical protein
VTKEPLEVEPAKPDQQLGLQSLLNYVKDNAGQQNVKYLPVGRTTEGYIDKIVLHQC